MVKDEEVDVVVITTPPGTHAALAREAVLAGKHGMWLMCTWRGGGVGGVALVCGGEGDQEKGGVGWGGED